MIFICYLDYRKSEKGEEKRIYNASEKGLNREKASKPLLMKA